MDSVASSIAVPGVLPAGWLFARRFQVERSTSYHECRVLDNDARRRCATAALGHAGHARLAAGGSLMRCGVVSITSRSAVEGTRVNAHVN